MKTNVKYILSIVVVGFTFALVLCCKAGMGIFISPPTVVISAPPPPAVVVEPPAVVVVPDYYVWDGYEYVGVVDGQCYYLGPGNVWIVCDPVRLGRFHDWELGHADWQAHAIHNTRYRNGSVHNTPRPMTQEKHEDQHPVNPPEKQARPEHEQGHNGPPQ